MSELEEINKKLIKSLENDWTRKSDSSFNNYKDASRCYSKKVFENILSI